MARKHKPGKSKSASKGNGAHWVGKSIPRKEEDRLLRGRGKFVDDYKLTGMLYLRFVRSPYAHARITGIDVSEAEAYPGVVCTLTGPEVAQMCKQPFPEIGPPPGANIRDFPMGTDKVRYQGEPIVAVVAETQLAAEDAAELVRVDYDALEPVIDSEDALLDKSILHESTGTNLVYRGTFDYGDVDKAFKQAAYVVHIDKMHFHRFSSTPLECQAVIARWDAGDNFIQYICNNQFPMFAIQFLSPVLGVPIDRIHCTTHDIGGGFGIKIASYPQMAVCALASRKAGGRPVKWVETRTEHMIASAHGNERTFRDTRVALDKNGHILAIESRHIDDCGAYPRYEPLGCIIWAQVLPGAYRFRNFRVDFCQVATNKCPVAPNRGYSRMQHLWFLERIVDLCAHELGIPADEMRLRNYIQAKEFPYTTPNGCVYDSGDYPRMLQIAQQKIGWDDWKRRQAEARRQGRWLGIGIGTTLDSGTNNFGQSRLLNPHAPFSGNSQAAICKLDIYGELVVAVGSVPQGQGHETVTAQVVADVFGLTPEMVDVNVGFDTDRNAHTGTSGTYASQFAVSGLSAVQGAALKLKKEVSRVAAFALKAKESELEFGVGEQGPEVRVRGKKGRSVNYWRIANLVHVNGAELPEKLRDITLNCRHVYRPPFEVPDIKRKYGNLTLTYSAQLHICVIEVDRETFQPKILDYAAVDDCGRVVNPAIVEGQVMGATAHGIGAALMESCVYDLASGNMLTATFSDYTPITAVNMPMVKYGHIESPSPFTFAGTKGMGEGGAAPLHTVCAALQDALYSAGVYVDDSHNTADSIFRRLQAIAAGQRETNVRVEQRQPARAHRR